MTPLNVKEKGGFQEAVSSNQTRIKTVLQIQKSQGDFPCFKTAYNYFCDPSECVWRKECLPKRK